jgi:elongator complex protein 6
VDGLSGLFLPKQRALSGRGGEKILNSSDLTALYGELQQAIQSLGDAGRVLLVVDQLDLVLATGGDRVGAVALGEMLLGLREVCGLFQYPSLLLEVADDRCSMSMQQS